MRPAPEVVAALQRRLSRRLETLYPKHDVAALAIELMEEMGLTRRCERPEPHSNNWTEQDVLLITYGDSVVRDGEQPLRTLGRFLAERLEGVVSAVHILPFFPSNADAGFAVVDYLAVDERLGDWDDISRIAGRFDLMADLVINHASDESRWFENFKRRQDPGKDYFVEASPDEDLSAVVRPRNSPLLVPVETADGTRHVWCTFGSHQVDLNFKNPRLLVEIVKIVRRYMDHGMRILRLDAVAFLWKEVGTPCIHLPQTHEVIRMLRLLIGHRDPEAVIITETNVPNRENLTYFGGANEAHAIYNFSLPPLLVHALITGNCSHLKTWMMSMPPAQFGTAYLNFIASHDGIGLRPAEGLLSDEELETFIETMRRFGGLISTRRGPDGAEKPYEVNISLFEALKGSVNAGPDEWRIARFICAHAIMLAVEGIPAIYLHSLLATENDNEKVAGTGEKRSINRHNWEYDELNAKLDDPESHHAEVFCELARLIAIRRKQAAFHPNATQYTLYLGDSIFAFWRQSMTRDQSIFAIHNVTDMRQEIPLGNINLIATDPWLDLISGKTLEDLGGKLILEPYQCVWLTNKF